MEEKTTIHQRLKMIADHYRLSNNSLGIIAKTSGVMIGKYMNGSEPGYQTIVNILTYYEDLSKQWFLFGEGEMLLSEIPKKPEQEKPTAEKKPYIEDQIAQLKTQVEYMCELLNKNKIPCSLGRKEITDGFVDAMDSDTYESGERVQEQPKIPAKKKSH